MNILFHTHEYNTKEGRPCTKRIDSLARYLSAKGHNITVLTSSHNKLTDNITNNKTYKVLYSYSTKNTKKNVLVRGLTDVLFGFTSIFKAIFKVGKVDVVVTTSPPLLTSIFGYCIGKIKRAKVVFDIRDIWPDVALEMRSFDEKSFYYKIFNFLAKFMYKHSDIITAVTPRKSKKNEKIY